MEKILKKAQANEEREALLRSQPSSASLDPHGLGFLYGQIQVKRSPAGAGKAYPRATRNQIQTQKKEPSFQFEGLSKDQKSAWLLLQRFANRTQVRPIANEFTKNELKKNYRDLLKALHPDSGIGIEGDEIHSLIHAYKALAGLF